MVQDSVLKHQIGIISDTHGLLRPEALTALKGSDLIIHAGDIGDVAVLRSLQEIAPVLAVRGNNDTERWAVRLPRTRRLQLGKVLIHVIHDVKDFNMDRSRTRARVVISGHSHRPSVAERQGTLFINPGSAGPRRFKLPTAVASLNLQHGQIQIRMIDLDHPAKERCELYMYDNQRTS